MIGYGKTAQTLHRRLQQQRRFAFRVVAVHEPDENLLIDGDVERLRHAEQISDAITRHGTPGSGSDCRAIEPRRP